MSDKKLILILILSAIGIRLLYLHFYPSMIIDVDSYGYYGLGNGMVSQPSISTIINPFRTPVYPLFISLLAKISGNFAAPIGTPAFIRASYLIMIMQSGISIFALTLFYLALRQIKIQKIYAFLFVLFEAVNASVYIWDMRLITESLSLSWIFIMSSLAVAALRQPKFHRLINVLLLGILGILLRPSFMMVPIVIFIFIAIRLTKVKTRIQTIFITLFYCFIVFTISQLNFINHGYFGIQNIGDINELGRILQFNLSVESAKSLHPLYEEVIDYRSKKLEPMPYTFINYYNVDTYSTPAKLNELKIFTQTVIRANLASYTYHSLLDVPSVVLAKSDRSFIDHTSWPSALLFQAIWFIGFLSQYLSFVGFFLLPFAAIRFFRHPTLIESTMLLFGTIGFAQVLVTAAVGPGYDYARLISAAHPFLLLFSAFWMLKIYRLLRNKIFSI